MHVSLLGLVLASHRRKVTVWKRADRHAPAKITVSVTATFEDVDVGSEREGEAGETDTLARAC